MGLPLKQQFHEVACKLLLCILRLMIGDAVLDGPALSNYLRYVPFFPKLHLSFQASRVFFLAWGCGMASVASGVAERLIPVQNLWKAHETDKPAHV